MTREEAIEVYNGLINQKIKEAFEFFAPELRESEDEMIRKRLLEYFQGFLKGYEDCYKDGGSVKWEGLDVKSILAWLEKQKEGDKAILAVDKIDRYIDLLTANAHDMKDSNPDKKYYRGWDDALGKISAILQEVYSGEKQKEQKPVQTEDEREYVRTLKSLIADFLRGKEEVDRSYYQKIYDWLDGRHIEQKPASTEDMPYITDEHFYEREPADSFKYKLAEYMTKCCTKKEGPYGYEYGLSAESILKMAEEELLKRGVVQKPMEWSEEDKENLLCVCGLLKHYLSADYKGSKYWDDAQVNEWIEWAKNLPNRFQLQPKQEWSEEDEKVYEYLKGGFEYATNNPELLSSRLSGKNDATIQDYKNFIDKLKFLRPQPKQELSEGDKKILDNVSQILIGLNYQELAKNYKQTIEKLWKLSER